MDASSHRLRNITLPSTYLMDHLRRDILAQSLSGLWLVRQGRALRRPVWSGSCGFQLRCPAAQAQVPGIGVPTEGSRVSSLGECDPGAEQRKAARETAAQPGHDMGTAD